MDQRNINYQTTFLYDLKYQRFDTTSYLQEQKDSNFSIEEVREFLAKAESQLTQHYKRFPQWLATVLSVRYVIIFAFIAKGLVGLLSIAFFILIQIGIELQTTITIMNILLTLFKVITSIFIPVLLCSIFWNRIKAKNGSKLRENIQAHIEQTYSSYQRKGVAWMISRDFFTNSFKLGPKLGGGIELWKYDPMQGESDGFNEPSQQNSQNSARLIEEFAFDKDVLKFASLYSPLKTRNQVSFEEVRQFFDQVAPSFSRSYKSAFSGVAVGILGLIGYVLLLKLLNRFEPPTILLLIASLSIHSVYIIIFIIVMVYYVKKWNKMDEAIIPNVQAIIDQTASQMNAKGFRWVLSKNYTQSVQLWEDKLLQIEDLQDAELPVQPNVGMYDGFENEDDEISQGHGPTHIQDNLLLVDQDNRRASFILSNLTHDRDIVFDYSNGLGKFISHHYFPGLTKNKISTDEIRKILMEIECKFTLNRRTCLSRLLRVSFIIACLALFVSLNLIIVSNFVSLYDLLAFLKVIWTVISIFLASIYAFLLLLYGVRSRMRKQMLSIIQQKAAEYEQKGLKWFIPQGPFPTIHLCHKNAT